MSEWWLIVIGIGLVSLIFISVKVRERKRIHRIVKDYKSNAWKYRSTENMNNSAPASSTRAVRINGSAAPSISKSGHSTTICSYCKKKAGRLAFYSKGSGQIIGVCSVCKVQAERQALTKI